MLKVKIKAIDIEYMHRVGFVVGPHIQMASSDNCVNIINETSKLDPKMIKIKKKFIYKWDVCSKALMTHVVEDKVKEIDCMLY